MIPEPVPLISGLHCHPESKANDSFSRILPKCRSHLVPNSGLGGAWEACK